MTSHIFLALGRWDDVVRANQRAVAETNRARQKSGKSAHHCGHYNIWLAYGYEQAGDTAAAVDMIRNCHRDVGASRKRAVGSQISVRRQSRSKIIWTKQTTMRLSCKGPVRAFCCSNSKV